MEPASVFIHIAGGCLAVLAGYVAIFAPKGGDLHRRSGTIFVYSIFAMGMFATVVAILRGSGSLFGGPIACYFVLTAVATVRPIQRRLDITLCIFVLTMSALSYAGAASLVAQGRSSSGGAPVPMIIFLATVMLLAGLADARILLGGALEGPRRIARHLWRMCFGFWIATGSFFLGQMAKFPVWLQKPALMAIPAMLPLVLMVYWLWRVRVRKRLTGLVLRPA